VREQLGSTGLMIAGRKMMAMCRMTMKVEEQMKERLELEI
jgi:hypothetical protein